MVIAFLVAGIHTAAAPQISVLDEIAHTDYVDRLTHLELPAYGSTMGQAALREEACRKHDRGVPDLPCGLDDYDPSDFDNAGLNWVAATPPLYYTLAAGAVVVTRAVPGVDGVVSGGRLASAALLGAGVLALWWLLGLVGADPLVRLGVAAFAATITTVLNAGSTVTADATGLLAGAATTGVVLVFLKGRASIVGLVVLGVALGLTKITNLPILGVVVLAAVMITRRSDHATRRRAALGIGGLVAAALLTYAAWSALVLARDDRPAGGMLVEQAYAVSSLPVSALLENVGALVPPVSPVVASALVRVPLTTWGHVCGWVVLGSVAMGLVAHDRRVRALSGAVAITAVIGGPAYVLFDYVTLGQYFVVPQRYGLVLLAPMLVGLAVSLRGRIGRVMALALPTIGLAALTLTAATA